MEGSKFFLYGIDPLVCRKNNMRERERERERQRETETETETERERERDRERVDTLSRKAALSKLFFPLLKRVNSIRK